MSDFEIQYLTPTPESEAAAKRMRESHEEVERWRKSLLDDMDCSAMLRQAARNEEYRGVFRPILIYPKTTCTALALRYEVPPLHPLLPYFGGRLWHVGIDKALTPDHTAYYFCDPFGPLVHYCDSVN